MVRKTAPALEPARPLAVASVPVLKPAQPQSEPEVPADTAESEPCWDEKFFPVTNYMDGPAKFMSKEVLARPEAFLKWAAEQDALRDNPATPSISPEQWRKEGKNHTGAIRHSPKN